MSLEKAAILIPSPPAGLNPGSPLLGLHRRHAISVAKTSFIYVKSVLVLIAVKIAQRNTTAYLVARLVGIVKHSRREEITEREP